jgi:hypothetical protein
LSFQNALPLPYSVIVTVRCACAEPSAGDTRRTDASAQSNAP